MSPIDDPVRTDTTRSYISPLREEQVRLTRRRILDAAHTLLVQRGYTATTMAAVAAAAAVSPQTVYAAFGGKPALVKALYDVVLAGDDEPIPMAARPEMVSLLAQTDPRGFLTGYAHVGRTMQDRVGPLVGVLVGGARAGERELRHFVAVIDGERLIGATGAVRHLAARGWLRSGLPIDRAADVMWTLISYDVWQLLVVQRGWSGEAAADFIAEAMAAALLD